MNIEVRYDHERGCGWRKPGDCYLMSGKICNSCDMLPIKLDRCPCCDHGIKPTRAWTWVNAKSLIAGNTCKNPGQHCNMCLINRIERSGLLWIGGSFYDTPQKFINEALYKIGEKDGKDILMGISRKIPKNSKGQPSIPRGFVVGETPVLLAHRKAITEYVPEEVDTEGSYALDADGETALFFSPPGKVKTGKTVAKQYPGVIAIFIPQAIEYVVKGGESEEYLESLVKRGITPVIVKKAVEQKPLEESNVVQD